MWDKGGKHILESQKRISVGIGIRVARKPPGCARIVVCRRVPRRICGAAHRGPTAVRTYLVGDILGAVEKRAVPALDANLPVVFCRTTGAKRADHEGNPDQYEVVRQDDVKESRHAPAGEVCLGGCEQDHDAKRPRVRRAGRGILRVMGGDDGEDED